MINEITKKIGSIKFSCVSPDEIRKMSKVEIITADTYDDEGYPISRGLMDSYMGVIEPGLRCKTCGCKVDECPGHFGHIELAMPVIHVGFIKDIKMMLESTCCSCGRLMLSAEPPGIGICFSAQKSSISLSARKRSLHFLQSISGSEKPARCPEATQVCGFIRIAQSTPTFSLEPSTNFFHHAFFTLFFSSTPRFP